MKNNNNNSSFLSHRHNPNDHHPHDHFQNPRVFICEFCNKGFTTGQALGGHKTVHRSNKQHDVNKGYKTMKITFTLSSSPSDSEQKRHSWTRVFKSTVHHPPPTASTIKPIQQQVLPAVDLLSFLPPRSYNTKKRSRRYLVDDGVALLDMCRDSVVNLDLNLNECKRMKVEHPSNVNDNEMMQKPFVPLKVVKEEKKLSEGETAVSRVVRNIDLNKLPTNDVETELGPKVVGNFDMNELPTNHAADEINQ